MKNSFWFQALKQGWQGFRLLIELKYYGEDPLLAEETVKMVRQAHAEEGDIARSHVDFLAMPVGQATAGRMKTAWENGMKVYAWTVNDMDGILDLMEVGIDGVITDDPAMARKAVEDVRKLSAMERLLFRFRHVWN